MYTYISTRVGKKYYCYIIIYVAEFYFDDLVVVRLKKIKL